MSSINNVPVPPSSVESSLYEQALTLSHFERLVGKCSSKQITQHTLDTFILARGKEVKRSTLNKDMRWIKYHAVDQIPVTDWLKA
jgi:hypothetical protein